MTKSPSPDAVLDLLNEHKRRLEESAKAGVAAEAATLVDKTAAPIVLKEGQKLFSDVFGFVPPLQGDFAVRQYTPEDWPEEYRSYIPERLSTFIWPRKETEIVVSALTRGKRAGLVHGPKGCGKSKMGEQVAAMLCIPFFRVNFSEDAESARLFGSVDAVEGSLDWVKGVAEMAAECGGLLQCDEIDAAPAGINLSMQWMLERGGKMLLENKPARCGDRLITPKPTFFVVGTCNTQLQGDTTGKYTGTQVQNEAFLDRMQFVIAMNYMTPDDEQKMIMGYFPALKKKTAEKMVQLAGHIRKLYDQRAIGITISPRGLLDWAEDSLAYGTVEAGFKYTVYDKFTDKDKPKAREQFQRIFGVTVE